MPKPVTRRVTIVDTETTGLLPNEHRVIEVAVLKCLYHSYWVDPHDQNETVHRGVLQEVEAYESFQDPGVDIPDEAYKVNRISADMVRGQQIDWGKVEAMLLDSDYIVAHSAWFDRAFLFHEMGKTIGIGCGAQHGVPTWVCSCSQIDWKDGITVESAGLRYLCYEHGIVPGRSHRATVDCRNLSSLLVRSQRDNQLDPVDIDTPYFEIAAYNARRPTSLVTVAMNGYHDGCNQVLREAGFRFSGLPRKVWWTTAFTDSVGNLLNDLQFPSDGVRRVKPQSEVIDGIDALSPTFKDDHQFQ